MKYEIKAQFLNRSHEMNQILKIWIAHVLTSTYEYIPKDQLGLSQGYNVKLRLWAMKERIRNTRSWDIPKCLCCETSKA